MKNQHEKLIKKKLKLCESMSLEEKNNNNVGVVSTKLKIFWPFFYFHSRIHDF